MIDYDVDYFFERLVLLESGYYPIDKNKVFITPKAQKILDKNPSLKQAYEMGDYAGAQKLHKKCTHGQTSYEFKHNVRGIGNINKETGTFDINWIGWHEEYNKVKNH